VKRSFRYKETKTLLVFGHDESIFKQYSHTKKRWVDPNRATATIPKNEGVEKIKSAFQAENWD
jgi:hypothetical protein